VFYEYLYICNMVLKYIMQMKMKGEVGNAQSYLETMTSFSQKLIELGKNHFRPCRFEQN
jgi:hypothetical protein